MEFSAGGGQFKAVIMDEFSIGRQNIQEEKITAVIPVLIEPGNFVLR